MTSWNPWHGCTKISAGCKNCYVYRRDTQISKNPAVVYRTSDFRLPIKRDKNCDYKIQPDGDFIYTCFTSDFFHPDSDRWRLEAWEMIKERSDLQFFFVTKRPERFDISLPADWADGYDNVHIACTTENQQMADRRLPTFLELPIKHKQIMIEPMLEPMNLDAYLSKYGSQIEKVTCGGESGEYARICDYDWILNILDQCKFYNVAFHFHQTGARFKKGNHIYTIDRSLQIEQAEKANIDFTPVQYAKVVDVLE